MGRTLFLCFSTFQLDSNLSAENRTRPTGVRATGVILVPFWQAQPWFTTLLHLLIDNPGFLPQLNHLLQQPHNNALHPIHRQLKLMSCKVSGKASSSATYQRRLQQSSCSHGQMRCRNNINCTSSSGLTFVVNDRLIPTIHL